MSHLVKHLTPFLLISVLLVAVPLEARWAPDGNPVCTAADTQRLPKMVEDGSGGVIIIWEDNRDGNWDIYAQRINRFGEALWGPGTVAVCADSADQTQPAMAPDGAGGAYIVWTDYRGTMDVYGQHIDVNGSVQWAPDGKVICDAGRNQSECAIVSDGLGGAIVTWTDTRDFIADIYAQRIDSTGALAWTDDGLGMCTATNEQTDPEIILLPDPSPAYTRAIIAWEDWRDSGTSGIDVYAQRINLDGDVQWGTYGTVVRNAYGNERNVKLTPNDQGGAIFVWEDDSVGVELHNSRIFLESLDRHGNRAGWTVWGTGYDPRITTDTAGGAIISGSYTTGATSGSGGQRFDPSGNFLWGTSGFNLYEKSSWYHDLGGARVAPDGSGGAVFCYYNADADQLDIYAQRAPADGASKLWGDAGVPVATSAGDHYDPELIMTSDSSAFIIWREADDIYVQRLRLADGRWGFDAAILRGVSDIPEDEGGWVGLRIRASDRDQSGVDEDPITGYNIWRKVEAPSRLKDVGALRRKQIDSWEDWLGAISETGSSRGLWVGSDIAPKLGLPPGEWESLGFHAALQESAYTFVVPTNTDSTAAGIPWETYCVTAHTPVPSVYYVSAPDSGYSVDNLAPGAPSGFAGEARYEPEGLSITWSPNPESDLAHYALHRGPDEFFVPSAVNLIASPTDTAYFDAEWQVAIGYYYKLAAVDRHDNTGPYSLLPPEAISGVGDEATPVRTFLAQNRPNPFGPTTSICFGISSRSHVSLEIYDAGGRLIRVLVDEERAPARYEETWDGKGESGQDVASGIYFCRLRAGAYSETRRIVLVK